MCTEVYYTPRIGNCLSEQLHPAMPEQAETYGSKACRVERRLDSGSIGWQEAANSESDMDMSDRPVLTDRQKEIYEFMKDKIVNRGYGPTVREIGTHFDIRSPNGVMCHLKALEKKGLITRESHMSRAIQLTESPQESDEPAAGRSDCCR